MSQDPRIEAAARQVAVESGYPDFMYPDGMAGVHAKSCREKAARILAAADKAATITEARELDELPVGSVVLGWALDGSTPYLRCRSAHGRLVWGCVGTGEVFRSADLTTDGFKARVIHWGTE